MKIEIKKDKDILFVKPQESTIESVNSREFTRQITDFIHQGNKILVLNLSQVKFMDSSGLGSLISIVKLVENSQGKLVICEAQDQVKKIFSLTHLDQVFQNFSNEKEAVDSLKIFRI